MDTNASVRFGVSIRRIKDDANIRGSMRSMLDRAMEVEITDVEGETWKREFEERFTFLFNLFDGRPFRLPPDDKGRERLSAAIYDASMVALDDCWGNRNEIEADKAQVQQRMETAMDSNDNMNILTGQHNTAKAVRERIGLMRWILVPQ